MMPRPRAPDRHLWLVAAILAVGIATAVNLITIAALWTAVADTSDVRGGLSENATQVLTTAFGGIIGVLGGYVGYRAGAEQQRPRPGELEDDAPPPTAPS